jgi:serine/threonine protein kinase
MTTFPLISEYDVAISNSSTFVLAPQFTKGIPVFNRYKQILGYSGGYSVVYPIKVNGKKTALRCWIKDPGYDIEERYARIKKHLQFYPTSYLVDFGYVDEGITIGGRQYPISYMEWINGTTLSQFIDKNINKANVMNTLADRFLIMVKELHSKNISHGDLQDGNIIVTKNSSTFDLKLVDYDSLYAPTLLGLFYENDLQGIPNYQHPLRYKQSNEKADYFSELVIYLSLLAYAEKSTLWIHGQEKKMLFESSDFLSPSTSDTFRSLETLSPKVKNLSYVLRKFCEERDTNRLLPLEQVIQYNGLAIQSYSNLSVFLCHSSSDKPQVRKLYKRLKSDNFDPWLDEEKLIPGQEWSKEIPKAVKKADVVIVCLSRDSRDKEGYIQKEITYALDTADEKPEGTIFLIPLKLEECEVPERISKWQWVNYFEKYGHKKLISALEQRAQEKNNATLTKSEKYVDVIRSLKSKNFYTKQIGTSSPGLILLLLDQSNTMANNNKAQYVADVANRVIYEIAIASRSGELIKDRFYVGVIGYGASIYPIVGGNISEVAANPLRIEQIERKVNDGSGGLVSVKMDTPVWVEPRAESGKPMAEAFEQAHSLIETWVRQNQNSFPPIIINVTDGEPDEPEKAKIAAIKLMSLGTSNGNVLLFNAHITSSETTKETQFPSRISDISDPYAKFLFEISSEIPQSVLREAPTVGLSSQANARGLIFNGKAETLIKLLTFGSQLAR